MKILILVALILQVIIVQETDGYEFGDIIEFPRKCGTVTKLKHYAIYVGPKSGVNVGQGDNDIFHRTRETGPNGLYCGFAKLENTRLNSQDTEANYLEKPGLLEEEDVQWVAALTEKEAIKSRINELKTEENCGRYNLLSKNCEHLATYVRYGESLSVQDGTVAGKFQPFLQKKQNTQAVQNLKNKLKELRENLKAEIDCVSANNCESLLSCSPLSS